MSIISSISHKVSSAAEQIRERAASLSTAKNATTQKTASSAEVNAKGGSGQDNVSATNNAASNDSVVISREAKEVSANDANCSADVRDLITRMEGSSDMVDLNDTTTYDADQIKVLQGSDKADEINVTKGEDGGIVVNVNGEEFTYSASEASNLIIDAGNGDDTINVAEDVANDLYITGGKGDDTIQGGAGNDTIVDNYDSNTIKGGAGNDTLIANGINSQHEEKGFFGKLWDRISGKSTSADNVIEGQAGNDYLEGGSGNDTLRGGAGTDYLYGLNGNDKLVGGSGNDYIDGGKGNDTINGGTGNDNLFGGKGSDTINGAEGDDKIAGGKGHDTISGGGGADHITENQASRHSDTITSDSNDTVVKLANMDVPNNIKVDGDDAFKQRIESDLETYASIEVGQNMLNALDNDGHSLTIVRTDAGSLCSSYTTGCLQYDDENNASKGIGANSTIEIDTTYHNMYDNSQTWSEIAPSNVLYHEMAHAYNYATGTADPAVYDNDTGEHLYNADGTYCTDRNQGVAGAEYQAVGDIDPTGTKTENPYGVTENDLRDYLGYEKRTHYWRSPNE